MPQQIELAKIELVQSRVEIDVETVEDYARDMRMGTNFPAIRVVFDGETYWCFDGCHRTLAARQARKATILARVQEGTRRDAVLQSCGVNATNGMRRTNEDKRRAVRVLLDDPEWSQWSNREIAERCKVSHTFVNKVRAELTGNVSSERTYTTKHGTVATMQTANIGQRSDPEPVRTEPERAVIPCRDCGQDFEDDGWAICKECRRKIFEPSTPEPEVREQKPEPGTFQIDVVGPLSAAPPRQLQETLTDVPTFEGPDYDGDEWCTPAEYIVAARRVMGDVDFDPASSEEAQEVVQALEYRTKEDDSLSETWYGRVWLNPPYSNPRPFTTKAAESFLAGEVEQCMILVNNATETGWFQSLLCRFPACFLSKRISFWHPYREGESPRQAQVVFYLGPNVEAFYDEFRRRGVLVEAVKEFVHDARVPV